MVRWSCNDITHYCRHSDIMHRSSPGTRPGNTHHHSGFLLTAQSSRGALDMSVWAQLKQTHRLLFISNEFNCLMLNKSKPGVFRCTQSPSANLSRQIITSFFQELLLRHVHFMNIKSTVTERKCQRELFKPAKKRRRWNVDSYNNNCMLNKLLDKTRHIHVRSSARYTLTGASRALKGQGLKVSC